MNTIAGNSYKRITDFLSVKKAETRQVSAFLTYLGMEEDLVPPAALDLALEDGRVGLALDVHHAPGAAVQP